jgi:hypothetical protein
MSDESVSTSTSNIEKRTSAAKLVEQLISKYRKIIFHLFLKKTNFLFTIRYILNLDGSIKSDDESRVSIKSATLTCLSHLSTIDPFAFFDSFDYPTESTCEIRFE